MNNHVVPHYVHQSLYESFRLNDLGMKWNQLVNFLGRMFVEIFILHGWYVVIFLHWLCQFISCISSIENYFLQVLFMMKFFLLFIYFCWMQVTVHIKGKTECYECQPKPAPKTYPVCTITSTPTKVLACVIKLL